MPRVAPALASSLAAGLLACAEPPSPIDPKVDLTHPATSPASRVSLEPLGLRTQADFDAFEDQLLERRGEVGPSTLVQIYEALAADARPAERPEDALLLMRLGVVYRDNDDKKNGFLQKALELGNRLRAAAPKSPHTLFFQGYVPFAAFGGRVDRPLVITAESLQFASACASQWRDLLAAAPDYRGPHDFDTAFLKDTVQRLDAAKARLEAAPPVPSAVAEVRALSRAEVSALGILDRFETAPAGDRIGLCRDWRAAAPAAASNRSNPELRMDLACAIQDQLSNVALPLIQLLAVRDAGAFDPCLWLGRLVDRVPAAKDEAAAKGLRCP